SNGQLNLELSAALATAVNDWQVAEWLDVDARFRASIAVSTEDPPRAVEEIERRASDKRFVQVQFSGRPHEPMGRRKYWPVYEACARNGLHVMSHAFGSHGNPIIGNGWPSYSLEEHIGGARAMQFDIIRLFASDYPHWDSDDPDFALPHHLPEDLKKGIYFENARKLYGLP